VKFLGEGGSDAGGLYNESLSVIAEELHSDRLSLFVPTSNARANVCLFCFVSLCSLSLVLFFIDIIYVCVCVYICVYIVIAFLSLFPTSNSRANVCVLFINSEYYFI